MIRNESSERLDPLNDYLFFKIMGEKGDEEQLLAFLNAVFGRSGKYRLVSVEIVENKTLFADIIGGKSSVLDIRAVLADGTKINIEVQLRNYGNMDRRSLLYWSREYTQGIEAGQDYLELPKVAAINIVNFAFLPIGNFHTVFHLREDSDPSIILTDVLEIHFLDMVKFKALADKNVKDNPLHRWLAWLDKDSPPELVKEAVSMDMAIQKAEMRVDFVSKDKEALHAYDMRFMAMCDYTSGINHARREGKKEGLAEGQKELIALLKSGKSIEEAEQILGINTR